MICGKVYIRFEAGMEDRIGEDIGPFGYVQLTYNELRISPDGEPFAYMDSEGIWFRISTDPKIRREWWTDVIIYSKD